MRVKAFFAFILIQLASWNVIDQYFQIENFVLLRPLNPDSSWPSILRQNIFPVYYYSPNLGLLVYCLWELYVVRGIIIVGAMYLLV